jgi:hypothetical protein
MTEESKCQFIFDYLLKEDSLIVPIPSGLSQNDNVLLPSLNIGMYNYDHTNDIANRKLNRFAV